MLLKYIRTSSYFELRTLDALFHLFISSFVRCYFFFTFLVLCVFIHSYNSDAVLPCLVNKGLLLSSWLLSKVILWFWRVLLGVFFFWLRLGCCRFGSYRFDRCCWSGGRSGSGGWGSRCGSWRSDGSDSWRVDRLWWGSCLGWRCRRFRLILVVCDIKWSNVLRTEYSHATFIQAGLRCTRRSGISFASPSEAISKRHSWRRSLWDSYRRRRAACRISLFVQLLSKTIHINPWEWRLLDTIKEVLNVLHSDQDLVFGNWKSLIIKLTNKILLLCLVEVIGAPCSFNKWCVKAIEVLQWLLESQKEMLM